MESLQKVVGAVNGVMWSLPMVIVILLIGVWFSIRMAAPQIRLVKDMVGQLVGGGKSSAGISSFQSFAMALGGRIGVANIAGVATAIYTGGPGALFWMWMTAFLGAPVAIAESSLAQLWKRKVEGEYRGGPAYYITAGLGPRWAWLAAVYAAATVFATTLTGPQIQANAVSASTTEAWGIDPLWVGITIAVLFCVVVFGGMHRLGTVVGYVVPFIAGAYILLGVVVVAIQWAEIPGMLGLIVSSAFGADAAFGGMLGAAIAWGVRRAIYSSEVGTGSSAQAAAAADVSHPVKQGLAQGFSAYMDTLFVCTVTGLMILSTGSYNVMGPDGELVVENLEGVEEGPAFTQIAIDSVLPYFGPPFVAIAMFFFAFTTLLSFGFYAETNVSYLMKRGRARSMTITVVRLLLAASIVFGAVQTSEFAWELADLGVGLYTWTNILALVLLSPIAIKLVKDYDRQRREGLDPVFDPSAVGITNAPVWEAMAQEYREHGDADRAAEAVADNEDLDEDVSEEAEEPAKADES